MRGRGLLIVQSLSVSACESPPSLPSSPSSRRGRYPVFNSQLAQKALDDFGVGLFADRIHEFCSSYRHFVFSYS